MKLPAVKRGGRPALPRPSMGIARQEQQTKLKIFGAAVGAAQDLARQKIESDIAEQNSAYGDEISRTEQELASIESMTPAQLREAGITEADVQLVDADGKDREYLLKHEWYPQLINRRMEDAAKRHGAKIMHAPSREAWLADQDTRRQDYVTRATQAAADDAQRQMLLEGEAKNSADLQAGNYQSIIDRVNTNPAYRGQPQRVEAWEQKARYGQFTSRFSTVLANGTSEDIYALSDELLDPERRSGLPVTDEQALTLGRQADARASEKRREEVVMLTEPNTTAMVSGDTQSLQKALELLETEKYTENRNGKQVGNQSGLQPREALTEKNRIKASLNAISSKQAAADTRFLSQGRSIVDRTIDALEEDPLLSMHEVDRAFATMDSIDAHHLGRGKSYPDQADADRRIRLERAAAKQEVVRNISVLPLQEQYGIIRNLEGRERSLQVSEALDTAAKAVENAETKLASNSIQYARQLGWQIDDLPAMLDGSTWNNDYFTTLAKRVDTDAAIATHWGKSAGPLDAQTELPILLTQLNELSQDDRNQWFAGAVSVMGEDASKVLFEQMFESDDYLPAMTGVLVAEGQMDVALQMQQGRALRDDENFIMKDITSVRAAIYDQLEDAYGRGPQRQARINAILDVVAYKMNTEGSSGTELDTGESYVEEAVELVTGGIVKMHGSNIEAPQRGVNSSTMNRFVDQFEEDPSRLPAVYGATPEQLAREWGGRFRLVPSEQQGVYYIRDVRGKNRLGTNTGSLLLAADAEGNSLEVPATVTYFTPPPRPSVRDVRAR